MDNKVVVVAESDVDVFASLAAAERYLEPIDVENGEVELVVDEHGRSYRAEVELRFTRVFWLFTAKIPCVKLTPVPGDRRAGFDALAVFVRRSIANTGLLADLADVSESEALVRAFIARSPLTT